MQVARRPIRSKDGLDDTRVIDAGRTFRSGRCRRRGDGRSGTNMIIFTALSPLA
jgi:hypothetical protein